MNLPNKRRLPPTIDNEKLIERANKVLKYKGAENYLQAKLFRLSTLVLINSSNPIFEPYKPNIKIKSSPQYKAALGFCVSFLKYYNQNETLSTLKHELGIAVDFIDPNYELKSREAVVFLWKCMKRAMKSSRAGFKERVRDFYRVEAEQRNKPKQQYDVLQTFLVQAPVLEIPEGNISENKFYDFPPADTLYSKSPGNTVSSPLSMKSSKNIPQRIGSKDNNEKPGSDHGTRNEYTQAGTESQHTDYGNNPAPPLKTAETLTKTSYAFPSHNSHSNLNEVKSNSNTNYYYSGYTGSEEEEEYGE